MEKSAALLKWRQLQGDMGGGHPQTGRLLSVSTKRRATCRIQQLEAIFLRHNVTSLSRIFPGEQFHESPCLPRPKKVSVDTVPDAKLEKLSDVVIKLTTTNICGSDLDMYEGRTDVEEGKILGHENLGGVVEVGKAVDTVKKGRQGRVAFQHWLRLLRELRARPYGLIRRRELRGSPRGLNEPDLPLFE
jgi:hypothetical protein